LLPITSKIIKQFAYSKLLKVICGLTLKI